MLEDVTREGKRSEREDLPTRLGPRRRPMIMIALALAVLAAGAVSVLLLWPSPSAPGDSGVSGFVTLGPLTPVARAAGPPNERPYEAAVRVVRAGSDDVVATVRSGANGRFRVNLAPGRYTLIGETPANGLPPYAAPVEVTVVAHSFTAATISFDTGIR